MPGQKVARVDGARGQNEEADEKREEPERAGKVRETQRHPLGGHRRDPVLGDRSVSEEFQRHHTWQGKTDDAAQHPDGDLIADNVAEPTLPVLERRRCDGEDHSDV